MQRGVSFLFSLDSDYKLSIVNGGDGKAEEEVGEGRQRRKGGHCLVTPIQFLWAVSLVDASLKAMRVHYYGPFVCRSSLYMICFLMFFFCHKSNYGSDSKHSHQGVPKEVGRECPRNHLS